MVKLYNKISNFLQLYVFILVREAMINNIQNINLNSANAPKTSKNKGASLITTETNLIGQIQADALTTAQKDEKKKKIAKWSIVGAVGVTAVGLILGGKFIPKSFYKKIGNFVSEKMQQGSENAKKLAQKVSNLFKKTETVANVSLNVNGGKDAYFKILFGMDAKKHPKFLNKHPKLLSIFTKIKTVIAAPFNAIDKWTSDLYRAATKGTIKGKWTAIGKKVQKSNNLITETLKSIPEADKGKKVIIGGIEKTAREWADDVAELIGKQKGAIEDGFGKSARQGIFSQMDDSMRDLATEFRGEVARSVKEKGQRGNLKKFIVGDLVKGRKETLAGVVDGNLSRLTNASKTGYSDQIETIMAGLADAGVIDKTTHTKKIAPMLSKIKTGMERGATSIKEDAFDKFRDINMGCAPTDFLLTAGEIGALGLYASQAKTKEEKTSVMLTTAIPLGLGIAGTTAATLGMVSGLKALLMGGAISLGSSIIGKSIDKIYRKNHNTENQKPTIVTLELPKEIQESALVKTVDKVVETVADA